ncbi:hypothetical protein [Candidatus Amarobacter glycogenicus]|jgi:hypothetical protein|uniref:hypothetical protein n=1 Tax=Candidatus Amarobacter glycogenicus TaxID=3140699 RepID=UPI0031CCA3E7
MSSDQSSVGRPIGRLNIVTGLFYMAAFMVYGFILIYLRDFSPDKEQWIAESLDGDHFEARLAHVHGNLFALLNITFGFVMLKLPVRGRLGLWASRLILGGLLMPVGILAEVYFGLWPVPVLMGGISILSGTVALGVAIARGSEPG